MEGESSFFPDFKELESFENKTKIKYLSPVPPVTSQTLQLKEFLEFINPQDVVFNFALTSPKNFVSLFPLETKKFEDTFYGENLMKKNIWLSSRKNLRDQTKQFRIRYVCDSSEEYKAHKQFKFVEYTKIDLTEQQFNDLIKEKSLQPKCTFKFKRYFLSSDKSFMLDVVSISEGNYYTVGRIKGSNNSISSIQSVLLNNESSFILPVRSKVMEYLYHTDFKFYQNFSKSVIEGNYYSHQGVNHFNSPDFHPLELKLSQDFKSLASHGFGVYVALPARDPFPPSMFSLEGESELEEEND